MRRLVIILTLLYAGTTTKAGEYSDQMAGGNNLYEKGQFKEALIIYDSLLSSQGESFELLYNLGNTYYKLDDLNNAILHYEKARKFNSTDEDLIFNIGLINSKQIDKVEKLDAESWISKTSGVLSIDGWAVLSVVWTLIFATCVFAVFYSSRVGLKRIYLSSALIMVVLFSLSFVFASKQLNKLSVKEGIIFESSVTVKSAPGTSGQKLFVIHEGLKVKLMDEKEEFVKIKMIDGNEGWVNKSVLKEI